MAVKPEANVVQIRPATLGDVAAIVALEREAWPPGLAADDTRVRARLAAFPAGQLVCELGGKVVGVAWSQRITEAALNVVPARFDRLTDDGHFTRSHVGGGEIFQLIGVAVSQPGRHLRLGRRLVDAEIALARTLLGVRRIVGFTRPVKFREFTGLALAEYAAMRDSSGRPLDPMLAFHLLAGARLVSLHPDFRPADVPARGCGVLIEYPLE